MNLVYFSWILLIFIFMVIINFLNECNRENLYAKCKDFWLFVHISTHVIFKRKLSLFLCLKFAWLVTATRKCPNQGQRGKTYIRLLWKFLIYKKCLTTNLLKFIFLPFTFSKFSVWFVKIHMKFKKIATETLSIDCF